MGFLPEKERQVFPLYIIYEINEKGKSEMKENLNPHIQAMARSIKIKNGLFHYSLLKSVKRSFY